MKTSARFLLLCSSTTVFSLCVCGALAQQSGTDSQQGAAVRSTSEEVLLDVVVRDKKGRAVNNLGPQDFQIFDNGELKKIVSFRLVQGGEAVAAGGARTQLDPLRQIRLVSMIFQSGSNDARRLARDAALDLIKSDLPQNVYVAVMTIDHKLEVLQAFTNDRSLLKRAIDRATHAENVDFSQDTAMVQKQLEQMLGPNTNGAQSPQEQIDNTNATLAAAGPSVDAASLANMAMAQMVLQMIQTEQNMAMAQGGRTDIYALLDAVKQQYRLPGRKTILYFSEGGFSIPQGMEEPFNSVISIANRSNVSFYPLDTRGLTTRSANSGAIDTLKSAGQSSAAQMANDGSRAVRPDEAKLFDTGIQSTRGNTQNTLANLAQSTGGALIANTNDLRDPLHKLEEDVLTYYEITYNPQIIRYDGSFRKISVKLASSDLRVQTRSGYIALPPKLAAAGNPLHSYEVPLLTALDSSELPRAFSYHAEAMHFRGRQNQSVCDFVIDVPLANVTFQKNSANESEGRVSYVALVKDTKGEVLKKFQNDIPMRVPPAQEESLKTMHFIYTEHFDLPPGHYAIESAVLDGEGNKVSARKSSLMMPPVSTKISISSIAIVRNMKPKDSSTDETDPLLVGKSVVSPTVNPVIRKTEADGVSFYVIIYPDKSSAIVPTLTMEFSRDGQVLGSAPAQLGEPDHDGRVQNVSTVPIAAFQPGEYSVRFITGQGSETAEEAVSFTIQ
jgi:VWFA-related protein